MLTFKKDRLLLLLRSIFTSFHSLFEPHHDPSGLSPSAGPANRPLRGTTRRSSAGPILLPNSVKHCIFSSNLPSSRQDRSSSVDVVTVLPTAGPFNRDSFSFSSRKRPGRSCSPDSVLPTHRSPGVKRPYD
jgi:hypothetical protein